jgi:hypothetical protein
VTEDEADRRARFEAAVNSLKGLRVSSVDYWDVHNFSSEPVRWDYGEWHHAVLGAELTTSAGPRTVTWTNRFHPYGIEVLPGAIENYLNMGEFGPQRVGPDDAEIWSRLIQSPIRSTATWWEQIEVGPSVTAGTGQIVAPGRVVDVPAAIRLDFDTGCVWFVAAMPQWPSLDEVFLFGDEVMVVFTSAKMRSIGFPESAFVGRI